MKITPENWSRIHSDYKTVDPDGTHRIVHLDDEGRTVLTVVEIVDLVEPVDCAHPFLAFRVDRSSGYHVAGHCRTCNHEGPQVVGIDQAREAFYASLEADHV